MAKSPVAIPYNSSGTEIATSANPLRTDPTGTTAQPVTDNNGSLTIDATSLPLPTGASKEETLLLIKEKTDNLNVLLSTISSEETLQTIHEKLEAIEADINLIKDTDGIKKIEDPLPSGENILGFVKLKDPDGNDLPRHFVRSFTDRGEYGIPVVLIPTRDRNNPFSNEVAYSLKAQMSGKFPYMAVQDIVVASLLEKLVHLIERIDAKLDSFGMEA